MTLLLYNITNETYQYVPLDMVDAQGRTVGAEIYTWEGDVEGGETAVHLFAFRPHATRNKRPYGVWHADRLFRTAAARQAAIDTYLQGVRKRMRPQSPAKTTKPRGR